MYEKKKSELVRIQYINKKKEVYISISPLMKYYDLLKSLNIRSNNILLLNGEDLPIDFENYIDNEKNLKIVEIIFDE